MKEKKNGNWFSRHKITVILVLILVVIIGVIASGSSSIEDSNQTSKKEDQPTAATTGQAVRDGKFEFTVNKMSCGETSVGSEYLETKAQGQFCRVNVTIKNIGNEAQTLSHSNQYTYNDQGQRYSADDTAAIYASNDSTGNSWYNEINPGNTVTGDIFFDVPSGITPVSIELHDSALSGGIKVKF